MKNIFFSLKKHAIYLLMLGCVWCIQGCDYMKLSYKEIDDELQELERKKKELLEAKAEKEKIKKSVDELIQAFSRASRKNEDEPLSKIGEALYLSLKHGYPDKCKEIITLSQNWTWSVVGRALNRAIQDQNSDLESVLRMLESAQEADKENKRTVIDYIVYSWLKGPDNIQYWKTALDQLYEQNHNIACYDFDSVIKNFTELSFSASHKNLKASFEKAAKNEIIQQYQRLFFAIPIQLSLAWRNKYKFSISDERSQGYYSDSEEEDAPHFNGVYNFTKHGVYNIDNVGSGGNSDEEFYDPVCDPEGNLINNYVTEDEKVTPSKLREDAREIWKKLSKDPVIILCVALRQNDGRIKKFVFTNEPSVHQFHKVTKNNLKKIEKEAHQRGYHIIMAQQAHAEAEMMQFLQERPTRYTHVVAMGCSRNHCPMCHEMMLKLIGPNYLQLSGNEVDKSVFKQWFIPRAFSHTITSHLGFSVESLKSKYKCQCGAECKSPTPPNCPKIVYSSKYWEEGSDLEAKRINEFKHLQLSPEKWESRPWKREKQVEDNPPSDEVEITSYEPEPDSESLNPAKKRRLIELFFSKNTPNLAP